MNGNFDVQGFAGATNKITSTDAAQSLPAALLTRGDGEKPIAIVVTVETNDIRVTYDGTTPTTSTGGAFGHVLGAGQSLRLTNRLAVKNFKHCSKTSGSHGVLHVTPEFERHDGQVS